MCGICGIYGLKNEKILRDMLDVLEHRGPDDAGIFVDNNISLGHRRLSIIDLSPKGHQPMANEDKSIWLVANGEIYNFEELRNELENDGHRFYSRSDSEVIIHVYEKFGLDFVKHFNGMFAFALYDKKNDRLVLARDPIGEKPLYYHFDGKKLLFASEIKAILKSGIRKEINFDSLFNYLNFQYTIGKETLFKGIDKLSAGHILVIEKGNLKIEKYWDIEEKIIEADEDYFIKETRRLLEESARMRMVADVPIGAFLSGGIDSASVVALSKPYAKEFHTFSVGFETCSELDSARETSRYLNTIHHELLITAAMVANDLSKIAWHFDEPLGDAAIINNYYLSKEARKIVKVVIAGEGGDELFAGYPNYVRNLKYVSAFRLPLWLRKIAVGWSGIMPGAWDIDSYLNKYYRRINFFKQPTFDDAHLYSQKVIKDFEVNYFLSKKMAPDKEPMIPPPDFKDPLARMLAIDCKNILPERYLMKSDKATMANSIEERLPLLDKKIIEFAFSIPSGLKIKNGQEKYILRKAMAGLLPDEILNRPKKGFGTPVARWLASSSLKGVVEQKLFNGRLVNELFEKEKIRGLLGNINKNNLNCQAIWSIFALQLWYETYFE
jgi:asparagine synthase (glutamine-hydrolysing)